MCQLEQMVCSTRNFLVHGIWVDLSFVTQVNDVTYLIFVLKCINSVGIKPCQAACAQQLVLLEDSAFTVNVTTKLTGI